MAVNKRFLFGILDWLSPIKPHAKTNPINRPRRDSRPQQTASRRRRGPDGNRFCVVFSAVAGRESPLRGCARRESPLRGKTTHAARDSVRESPRSSRFRPVRPRNCKSHPTLSEKTTQLAIPSGVRRGRVRRDGRGKTVPHRVSASWLRRNRRAAVRPVQANLIHMRSCQR